MTSLPTKHPIRRALAAFVLITAGIVAPAQAAQADTGILRTVVDEFCCNAASRWSTWSSGSGVAIFDGDDASIFHTLESGWTEISRRVTIPVSGSHTCFAGVTMTGNHSSSVSTVNVEVINPSNWTYVATKQGQVSGDEPRGFTTGQWSNGPKTVVFRVSLLASGAYRTVSVDDMRFICSD